jgi:hypothetical protein
MKMRVSELPEATAPLSGSEYLHLVQQGVSRKVPIGKLAASIGISVKGFGALGNGSADDTKAFQRAIDAATAETSTPWPFGATIFVPRGCYRVAGLRWNGNCSVVGEEVATSTLRYNGEGGAGSYIIGLDKGDGAVPFSGLSNMTLDGFNPEARDRAGAIAEMGYFQRGGAGIDWGWKQQNLQFMNFFGNAVHIEGEVVNMHVDRVRWDRVGGWGVFIAGALTQENRPLSLTRFSYDNAIEQESEVARCARELGLYDGVSWGKGVLKIAPVCDGVSAHVSDGRVELNQPSRPDEGATSWFHLARNGRGTPASLSLQNVRGFFARGYPGAVVYLPTGNVWVSAVDTGATDSLASLIDRTDPGRTVPAFARHFLQLTDPTQGQGMFINGIPFEVRHRDPSREADSLPYRPGAIVLNAGAPIDGANVGWINAACRGSAAAGDRQLTAAAALTVTSERVAVAREDLEKMTPGQAVRFTAPPSQQAAFETQLIGVDVERCEVVLAEPSPVTANPCTMHAVAPCWRPFGIIGGVQAPARPTSRATTLPELVEDFNRLLEAMRTAKLMAD